VASGVKADTKGAVAEAPAPVVNGPVPDQKSERKQRDKKVGGPTSKTGSGSAGSQQLTSCSNLTTRKFET
jgi:hypothetical protein